MRRIFAVGLALFLLGGCEGKGVRISPLLQGSGLTSADYAFLQQLNDNQSQALQAARSAPSGFRRAQTDEKLQKMIAMIKDSGCRTTGAEPPSTYTKDWQSDLNVSSAHCVIRFEKSRAFIQDQRRWIVRDRFEIHDGAFLKLSPLQRLERYGEITAVEKSGLTTVTGSIHYSALAVDGMGFVRADIQTSQRYGRGRGAGEVILTLRVSGHPTYTAVEIWSLDGNQTSDYVNGESVDPKTFMNLFSAYNLDEIMQVSMAIR